MTTKIERAKQIRGWMSDPELSWLSEAASNHSVIVEVGCYVGRSTRALGDNTKGIVVAIDDFEGVPDEKPLSSEGIKKLYREFRTNLEDLLSSKKVTICHPTDISELQMLQPDFVFIDGSHAYSDVVADIKYWSERLIPGGLLSGHDCNYEPIKQALQDHVPNVRYAPQTSIWYTYK